MWGKVGAPQPGNINLPTNINSKYHELSAQAKQEIDNTYNNFKKPMKEGLDLIEKSTTDIHDRIVEQLDQIKLSTLKLENKLDQLRLESDRLREESKKDYRDAQRFGRGGVQQISNR
jgi:hypothetical protein